MVKAKLTGRLFDARGEVMSPTFSRGKSGRAYRYYVSASLQQGGTDDAAIVRRVPASAIEQLVTEATERWLSTSADISAIRLCADGVLIELPGMCHDDLALDIANGERVVHSTRSVVRVLLPVAMPLRGGKRDVTRGNRASSQPDRTLIAALRRAHRLAERERGTPLVRTAPASPYERKILQLAFLAPDLQQDILEGRQPPGF